MAGTIVDMVIEKIKLLSPECQEVIIPLFPKLISSCPLRNISKKKSTNFKNRHKIKIGLAKLVGAMGEEGSLLSLLSSLLFLPSHSSQALSFASVIGQTFNLETVSRLLDKNIMESATVLWPAVQTGLIWPMSVFFFREFF
jgi:hypothetical protein